MAVALISLAVPAFTLSRCLGVASEARMGILPSLAGRLCASGLFGAILEQPSFGFLDPLARRAAREERVDARTHAVTPSVLTVRGNRASLPGSVATSADLPNLAAQEVWMISRQYIAASTSVSVAATSMAQASVNAVTKYPATTSKLQVKSSIEIGARVARFLRKLHPRKTAELVAAETGLAVSTVATWLEGRSVPGGNAVITLIAVYGPGFLASVMPGSFGWLSDAARAAEQDKLEREIKERQRALAELLS